MGKTIIICTVDGEYGMTKDESTPWNISENSSFLLHKTKDNVVVMGRKLWFLQPDMFPDSTTYVLSENLCNKDINCGGLSKLNELTTKHPQKDIYIIGGKDIIKMFMYSADQIILTRLRNKYKCDVFFPLILENYEITSFTSDLFSHQENCFYDRIYYKKSKAALHPEYAYSDICQSIVDGYLENNIYITEAKSLIFDVSNHFPLFTTVKTDIKKALDDVISALNGNGGIGFSWRFFGAKYSHLFEEKTLFEKKDVFGGVDQISDLDSLIIYNPMDRNLMLTCCNPIEYVSEENICQFYTIDRHMSLIVTIPKIQCLKINQVVAFYTTLLYIFSSRSGKKPDKIFFNFGRVSAKDHQIDKIKKIITKTPRPFPVLSLDNVVRYKKIHDLKNIDFTLIGHVATIE